MTYESIFEMISGLKDGWYDGNGKAVDKSIIDKAKKFVSIFPEIEFYIYPTQEGGILIEFEIKSNDFSDDSPTYGAFPDYGIEFYADGSLSFSRYIVGDNEFTYIQFNANEYDKMVNMVKEVLT